MLKDYIVRILRHAGIFFVAKSTVLIAPFFAAAFLSQKLYGQIEWWLSLSMAIGPLLGFGASGVIAYGTLGGEAKRYVRPAVFFVVSLSLTVLVGCLVFIFFLDSWKSNFLIVVSVMSVSVALQLITSSRLKALGKGAWASVIESNVYAILLLAVFFSLWLSDFVEIFVSLLFLYCLVIVFFISKSMLLGKKIFFRASRFFGFFRLGFSFLVSASLMGIFMASPRIFLGSFDGPEAVAQFSLVFRWLSISIIIHQFAITVFFKTIYAQPQTNRQIYLLASVVACVTAFSFFLALLVYYKPYAALGIPYPPRVSFDLIVVMSLVMTFWATSASLEGILYRAGALNYQGRATAIGLIVAVVVLVIINALGLNDLKWVAAAWAIGFFVILSLQFSFIRDSGLLFKPMLGVCLFAVFVCLVCLLFDVGAL